MAVTMPTADLVGVFSDVIPFADPGNDLLARNCVRVEWDGSMLHTLATDMVRLAIASWHPDDEPDEELTQDDLFTRFGSGDSPWHIAVPLDDAKDLAKVFKLPPKEGRVPLTVDMAEHRLVVRRSRDTGHSALTVGIDGAVVDFPDLRKLLADAGRARAVPQLAFTAKQLADFAKVRARGPLRLSFTGPDRLVHVAIGERFVGAVMPVRDTDGGDDR